MTAAQLLRLEVLGFVTVLALAVAWKLMSSRISTRGLLTDASLGGFSPARLQLMLATLVGAASYLNDLAHNPDALPEPGAGLLVAVGGSNAIQLGGKLWSLIRRANIEKGASS